MKTEALRRYGVVSEVDEQTVRVDMLFGLGESFVVNRGVLGDMQVNKGDGLRFVGRGDTLTIRNIGPKPKTREDRRALLNGINQIMSNINLDLIREKFGNG